MPTRLTVLTSTTLALAFSPGAVAEVTSSAPDGFHLECRASFAGPPAKAWARVVRIQDWWSPDHTYSGDAKRLRLSPFAGGVWKESWAGGEVVHGRVAAATPPTLLRLDAPLGPLQEMGVAAALTIQLRENPGGTDVTFSYRVSGADALALDRIAPVVDRVICEAAQRFAGAS